MSETTSEKSDQKLVEKFQTSTGDQKRAAFEVLYRRYRESLWGYIVQMTENARLANEFTQETFLRAMGGLDDFEGKSRFKTWLYSIAINLWRNYMKKKRPESGFVEEDDTLYEKTPEQLVEKREEINHVQDALSSLPEKFKIPLLLVRYEDMTYREAAEAMEITLEALRMRVYRGQKALKEKLVELDESLQNS